MPIYAVTVLAMGTVLVEAENEDEAGLMAMNEVDSGDLETMSGEIDCVIRPEELERYRRHGSLVLIDED
ncbi:hypothetical protein P3W55_13740 [Pseudomonas citronellolis]|uniref:Uncharacterized protein n=1 Tax=Pseudomonas citronellolis TaxID=53408 RepID=A0AAW6P9C1_9PSED|nr:MULTISPECIES: hypothetical protein [Pseudomonas aeruginosa group]KSJ42407.1 hypothetical protein APA00_07970 [Pseudomonas aeruginosa]MDF3842774.1 hypothetical protein [Pseudomonas citronellolis]HBN7770322.1 hypothetical protein [Pseudomonas aeruginosa]HBN8085139.1 hypothetical protein [Pseudomonas aeruginosa]HBN9089554.1 hypothetical protein [Pseudomonas aeruginosa]